VCICTNPSKFDTPIRLGPDLAHTNTGDGGFLVLVVFLRFRTGLGLALHMGVNRILVSPVQPGNVKSAVVGVSY
jgi:hypothetical protein